MSLLLIETCLYEAETDIFMSNDYGGDNNNNKRKTWKGEIVK
jgi:hypothetical protein